MVDNSTKIFNLYDGKIEVKFYGPTEDKPNRHMYFAKVGKERAKRVTGVTTFIGIKDKSTPLQKWQQQITVDFLLKLVEKGVKLNHDLAIEAAVQNEILKTEAADLGNEIHAWCEQYINHKLGIESEAPEMPEDERIVNGVNAFLEWENSNKVKFVQSEKVVYSKKYGYVGTLDLEAEVNDMHCLIDLKSSNGLYNSVRMQTEAYVRADEEERSDGKQYDGRWALRLSKYDEDTYYAKEERKKEIKRFIAKSKGYDSKDYDIPEYQVFEAKYLDDDEGFADRDFRAFLNCMELHKFEKETNKFLVGDNW